MERDIKSALNRAESVGTKTGRGIGRNVAVGLSSSQGEINARASQIGEQIGTVIAKPVGVAIRGLKAGVGVAAVGVAGVLAGALKSGFDRLESIDTAKFKLKALGHTAEDVQSIMDSALASVKGTAFSLDQSATAAASAVAAGIKPGQQLTKYLTDVADAAAVAGTGFSDMGTIFNQVQTANVAFTGDLRQLADRGLPIFQWLQEATGKTGEEFTKFVEQGGIDAATFQEAIEKHIGGAALTMGESFSGSVDNLKASVARLGANFLTAILGGDPADPLKGPIDAVQKLTVKFDQIGVWVATHGPGIHAFFADMVNDVKPVVEQVGKVLQYLGEHPRQIEAVVVAFAAWKTIAGVAALITAIETITTGMAALPAVAATSAAGMSAAFAPVAATVAGILAAKQTIDTIEPHQVNTPPSQRSWWDSVLTWMSNGAVGDPPKKPADLGPVRPPRAYGGALYGSGAKGKDSIPILAAPGEHMLTASDVDAMGGQGNVYAFRRLLHMEKGGGITPEIQAVQSIASAYGLRLTSGFRDPNGPTVSGVAAAASYHGSGEAGDFSNGIRTDEELAFATYMARTYGTHIAELIHDDPRFNMEIKDGHIVPRSFYASAGDHTDHVHVAFKPGSAPELLGNSPPPGSDSDMGEAAVPLSQGPGGTWTSPNAAWAALIKRESGGNASIVQQGIDANSGGNEASGLFQIAKGTWAANGGTQFAPTAGEATPQEQAIVAARILNGNPTGADWGAGLSGRENAADLRAGLVKKQKTAKAAVGSVLSDTDSAGTSGTSGMDGSQLGQSIISGMLQTIGLDGSLFSNPLEWPNVKSIMAGVNFGASLLRAASGQSSTDGGGPSLPGMAGLLTPIGPTALAATPMPDATHFGTGAQPGPGPAIINNGTIGMDPRQLTQRVDAAQNQAWRRNMTAVRPG